MLGGFAKIHCSQGSLETGPASVLLVDFIEAETAFGLVFGLGALGLALESCQDSRNNQVFCVPYLLFTLVLGNYRFVM